MSLLVVTGTMPKYVLEYDTSIEKRLPRLLPQSFLDLLRWLHNVD